MEFQNIDQIYLANAQVRDRFGETIGQINAGQVKILPDGEKWSIEQIVEHVSIVDEGMAKICRKLLGEAQKSGLKATGEIQISDVFRAYTENVDEMKLEAPERVHPTGQVSIDDSRRKLSESHAIFESLLAVFGEFDSTNLKFPHPYFGPLSAQDWLVLAGEHMHRHTKQIEKILEKIRQ